MPKKKDENNFIVNLRKALETVYNSPTEKKLRKEIKKYHKYYRNHYWKEEIDHDLVDIDPIESQISANIFFSTVETTAPLLTDNKPVWNIVARKPLFNQLAQVYKKAAECLWDTLDMDMKMQDMVKASLISGTGVAKVFFDENKGTFGEICVELIPRAAIVCPEGYTDYWDAPWIGMITKKPLSWVRENFPDRTDIKPDDGKDEFDTLEFMKNMSDIELAEKFVTVYEVWMKDSSIEEYLVTEMVNGEEKKEKKYKSKYPNGRMVTFCKTSDEPLKDIPYPYNHGKPPYVPLYDYKEPFSHTGMGEMAQIEGAVLEYNVCLRKVAKWIHNWTDPDWVVPTDCGIKVEQFKKERPRGGNVWPLTPGANPPTPLNGPQIDQNVLMFLSLLPQIVEEITGVTDITKGQVGKKSRQSAREIATLVETSYTRTRQRVRNLEWTLKRMMVLIVELMQQWYFEPRSFANVKEGKANYFMVSNSQAYAQELYKPTQEPKAEDSEEEKQIWEDYEELTKYISENLGEDDAVYADFDIIIETNSTLPMDRQSMANLMLQLASVQITPNSPIDAEALLTTLKIQETDKILERKKVEKEQAIKAAQGGRNA